MKETLSSHKVLSIVFLVLLLSGTATSTYLINSEDWKDVYSSSYYAQSNNDTPYFTRSDNLGVFNVLPYGEPVNTIESTERPVISNIANQAESQGYNIGESTSITNGNLELRPEEGNIIVVPEDYPSAAVVAAPYARITNSWVLIVNNENLEEVEQIVSESPKSVMIGDFNRDISDTLEDDIDEKIISPSKFNLSVKVTEKYLQKKDSSRVMITSGDYISRGITKGDNPILLSGTNYLPEEPENFLLENPQHNISSAIMIGNEMTSVGEEIRDMNISRNGEKTDEKISVFVKYGQARGDSNSIYAISLFPLPTGDIQLRIPSAEYNPANGEVVITYQNTGESRMYQLTSFEIISSGETIATGGDDNPVFVGGNTNRTISYDVNISESNYADAELEFSTTYGTSPRQLDTYLTEDDRFSPPLRKNLTLDQIQDDSNMTVKSVEYVENLDRFRVNVANLANQPGYAQVRLTEVEVKGQEQSFASDRKKIPAGETKKFYIVADLDRIDLDQNDQVKTSLSFGEQSDSLVQTERTNNEMKVVQNNTNQKIMAGGIVLLIIISFLLYRRSDMNLEISL